MFVMFTVPQETTVRFFNSLMHGVDLEPIMRWDVPLWESAMGMAQTLLLGWMFGALCAAVYNLSLSNSPSEGTTND